MHEQERIAITGLAGIKHFPHTIGLAGIKHFPHTIGLVGIKHFPHTISLYGNELAVQLFSMFTDIYVYAM